MESAEKPVNRANIITESILIPFTAANTAYTSRNVVEVQETKEPALKGPYYKQIDYSRDSKNTNYKPMTCLMMEFAPSKIGLDVIVTNQGHCAGYFIGRAQSEYGNRLAFIVSGTFEDEKKTTLVGKVLKNGRTLAYGYEHVNLMGYTLACDENRTHIYKGNPHACQDTAIGGLVPLINNGHVTTHETNARKGVRPEKTKLRFGYGKKANTDIIIAGQGSLSEVAETLMALGCTDAVAIDRGGKGFLYTPGRVWKRDDIKRMIKTVIVGYLRQQNENNYSLHRF